MSLEKGGKLDNFYSPENAHFYSTKPYPALNSSERDIRLIRVLDSPDTPQAVLSCELQHVSLLSGVKPKYTALSYAAGDPKNTASILVNNVPFNAFANLAQALKDAYATLKKWNIPPEDQWIWADQIVIDQSNPEERSHQVAQMLHIYQSASRVLVCLSSPGTHNSGIQWLHELIDYVDIRKGKTYNKQFDNSFIHGWTSFYDLLDLSWWERAWIVQEFLVCKETHFLYNDSTIHWKKAYKGFSLVNDFENTILSGSINTVNWHRDINGEFQNVGLEFVDTPEAMDPLQQVLLGRHLETKRKLRAAVHLMEVKFDFDKPDKRGDLILWLDFARGCKVSDPRDRVYAFLGVAHPSYQIVPDYLATTREVYITTARQIIQESRNLHILLFAVRLKSVNTDELVKSTLPSWVPNWSLIRMRDTKFVADLQKSHMGMSASDYWPADPMFPPDDNGTPNNILQVSGIRIDTLMRKMPSVASTPPRRFEQITEVQEYVQGFSPRDESQEWMSEEGRLIVTGSLVSSGMEVWVLMGASVPYVLWEFGSNRKKVLVSAARIIGRTGEENAIMMGEAVKEMEQGLRELEMIRLV